LEIIINNQITINSPSDEIKDSLVGVLKHKNPKFVDAERLGYSTYGVNEYIHNFSVDYHGNLTIPRGMRDYLFTTLKDYDQKYKVKDERSLNYIDYLDCSNIQYRPYQSPAVTDLINFPEGVLVAPAGSGKTVMGLSLMPILMQTTLWLTHTDRLFKQSHERCKEFLPDIKDKDIGFIGAGKWEVGNILTVGMVQTLIRNLPELRKIKDRFGLVILDEAHHCPASTFTYIISVLNPYYLYGLTATDYRRDGLENIMFQTIGPIRSKISKGNVTKHKGIISPKVLYCPVKFGDRVEINNTNKILNEHIIYNSGRNKRIRNDVLREARGGKYCIVSSNRKNHCEVLYKIIKKEWPKTGIATGKYSKKKIDEQVLAFNNNEITVLITTPDLLGEGFDIDFLDRLFLTTSFRVENRVEQLVGRIQRFHPNKKDAIVYDYVDENIGVFKNQFYSKYKDCRSNVYNRLGLKIIHYGEYFNN
jgi:superfamily II DNA or RNA helicase